jgi:hypothetical protein
MRAVKKGSLLSPALSSGFARRRGRPTRLVNFEPCPGLARRHGVNVKAEDGRNRKKTGITLVSV